MSDKRYGLEWSRNMRALMQDHDTHPDQPEVDWSKTGDDAFTWVPVDPDHEAPNDAVIKMADDMVGSYDEIARTAVMLNARQDKMGNRAFTFYPHELEVAGKAA